MRSYRFHSALLIVAALLLTTIIFAASDIFEPQRQPVGYIAPVAISNPDLSSGNETLFQPTFETGSYQGELVALPISAQGKVATKPKWQAAALLNAHSKQDGRFWDTRRKIFTASNGEGIPFRYNYFSSTQKALVVNEGVVNYIRGQRKIVAKTRSESCKKSDDEDDYDHETNTAVKTKDTKSDHESDDGHTDDDSEDDDEGENNCPDNAALPPRSLLGDIMHSRPVYVGRPREGYPFDNYGSNFAASYANRKPIVYVGANDGLLHAFDAQTGEEVFGYVPSAVLGNLPRYAGLPKNISTDHKTKSNPPKHDSDHDKVKRKDHDNDDDSDDDSDDDHSAATPSPKPLSHTYFVDGQITAGDVFIGGMWRTVLVGGLGAGGQSFFALDVTDPTNHTSSETDLAKLLLWEYSDTQDADIGFSYSRASIVRLNDAQHTWAAIIGNGYGSAYSDGKLGSNQAILFVINIQTGALIKKMSVGTAGANGLSSSTIIDTDGNYTADIAYAGDLQGQLWKFDLSAESPSDWKVALSGQPLFIAKNKQGEAQAITTAPAISRHPFGGYMINIATGRMLTPSDSSSRQVQSIYGLWDKEASPIEIGTLQVQTLSPQTKSRTISSNPINWRQQQGWMVNLPAGERVLTDPLFHAKRVQLTSTNPTIASGENWLIEIDSLSGAASSPNAFDLNENSSSQTAAIYQGLGLASKPVIAQLSATRDVYFINQLRSAAPTCQPGSDEDEDEDDHDEDDEHEESDTDHTASSVRTTSKSDSRDKGDRRKTHEDGDDDDDDHDDESPKNDCAPLSDEDEDDDSHRDDDGDDRKGDSDKQHDENKDSDNDGEDDEHRKSSPTDSAPPVSNNQSGVNSAVQHGYNPSGRLLWREMLLDEKVTK